MGLAKLVLEPRSYVGPRPYDLRHSFASLQLAAGTSPLEVADMLGHGPQILFNTYAHVIAELKGQPPVPAEDRIATARERTKPERDQREQQLQADVSARQMHVKKWAA